MLVCVPEWKTILLLCKFSIVIYTRFVMILGGSADEQYMYGILCQRYSDVVSFTALNTRSLWDFAKKGHDASTIAMVKNVDEHILVYKYVFHYLHSN